MTDTNSETGESKKRPNDLVRAIRTWEQVEKVYI